ncbi:hypothetical protein [Sphingobium sp. B11D3A]|uniref:hypothetical protein n=1 Tax=Sphingobium sp. B11D3A TaxID=2940574 RepID=UPI00222486C4|nr:hypothetical protein [Sphingobium sp. B11D3A]MCW2393544.1 hypothetical protein [Sphingobium sp. B11D3A]
MTVKPEAPAPPSATTFGSQLISTADPVTEQVAYAGTLVSTAVAAPLSNATLMDPKEFFRITHPDLTNKDHIIKNDI